MTLGLYFTRTNRSIRAWFPTVRNGQLIDGAIFSDFSASVIDSYDLGSISLFVTESLQKPGMYYFDIPASFLLSYGVGDYGISIEINKTSSPKVTDVIYGHLQVSKEDFDSLSGSIWGASSAEYTTSGTMGFIQNEIVNNLISGSGVTVNGQSITNIVDSIWNEQISNHLNSGSTGVTLFSASRAEISASVTVDNAAIAAEVWNSNTSSYNSPGSMGWLQNKVFFISQSMDKVRAVTCGRWIISGSQMIFYDDDNITEVTRFNLFDTDGNPFISETGAPVERVVV